MPLCYGGDLRRRMREFSAHTLRIFSRRVACLVVLVYGIHAIAHYDAAGQWRRY
jgi:hypothetical protein